MRRTNWWWAYKWPVRGWLMAGDVPRLFPTKKAAREATGSCFGGEVIRIKLAEYCKYGEGE